MDKKLILFGIFVILASSVYSTSFYDNWDYASGDINWSFDCESLMYNNVDGFVITRHMNRSSYYSKFDSYSCACSTGPDPGGTSADRCYLRPNSTYSAMIQTANYTFATWWYYNQSGGSEAHSIKFMPTGENHITNTGTDTFKHISTDTEIAIPMAEWFIFFMYHSTGNLYHHYMLRDDGTATGNYTYLGTYDHSPGGTYSFFEDGINVSNHWDNLVIFRGNITAFPTTTSLPDQQTIDINFTYPVSSEHIKADYHVNVSLNMSGYDCELNDTDYSLNWDNGSFFQFTSGSPTEGPHSVFVNCTNGSITGNATTLFYIDTTNPVIATSFQNDSFIYSNLTTTINLSDNILLYQYNISIDGVNVDDAVELSTTFYQINFSYDITSLALGSHVMTLRVSDAHTKNLIDDYDVKANKNELKFEFKDKYNKGWVKIKSVDSDDGWSFEKKTNRYSFGYIPDIVGGDYSYIVESSFGISIIDAPDSPYKKWLVFDEHWIDFVSPNVDVEFTRLTDKKVQVDIKNNLLKDVLEFNSVGDLNIVTQNFTFIIINTTESHIQNVIEQSTNTFYLNISDPTASVNSVSGYIIYNNTNYTATISNTATNTLLTASITAPDVGANTDVSFYWYVSTNINSFNVTGNQTVAPINIDNCTRFTDLLINFTVRDENNLSIFNHVDSLEVEASIINKETLASFVYNIDTNLSAIAICISNDTIRYLNDSFYLDVIAGFEEDGHVKEFWYLDNGTINGSGYFNSYTSNIVDLYDLLTTDSSTFLFEFTDEDGLQIDNAIIHTYRKYIGDAVYREVERSRQDDNGETHVHLIEEDAIYYFVVSQYGVVKYTSNTYNAKCLSDPCSIELKASQVFAPFPEYSTLNGSLFSISANKTTRIATLNYISNATHLINFTVYSFNGNVSYINSSTFTGTSGTISLTIPISYGNQTYIGAIYQDGEFIRSEWISLRLSGRDYFGGTGAFLSGVIVMGLGLMALSEGVLLIVSILAIVLLLGILALVDIGWFTISALICAGGIIIWAVIKKKNG